MKPDDKIKLNDVIVYKDGSTYCMDGGGFVGSLVGELTKQEATLRVERHGNSSKPQIEYIDTTTVVRWPDGKITASRPCKANKKRGIKADKVRSDDWLSALSSKKALWQRVQKVHRSRAGARVNQ